MAARRLWLALAVELAAYIALILVFVPPSARSAVLAVIPGAMLVVRFGLVLISFALSEPLPTATRLRPLTRVRTWLDECIAFCRFLLLIMSGPGREVYTPHSTEGVHDKRSIVLLHGIFCSGAIWRPIAAALAARTGCEVRTPTLPHLTAALSTQVEDFAALLEPLRDASGERDVIVIGHSLGGLIARHCAIRYGERLHIGRVICIGAPHAGSRVARISLTSIARDIRPNSAALACACDDRVELINIHGEHDNLVVPARSSLLSGARNIAIAACGHMALIYSPKVLEILVDEVGRHRDADSRRISTFR